MIFDHRLSQYRFKFGKITAKNYLLQKFTNYSLQKLCRYITIAIVTNLLRSNIMKLKIVTVMVSVLLLQACATPTVVETRKVNDNQLSCSQIQSEIEEAKSFEQKARKERTVTGKNVAAAVLFWPALLGTYSNTEEAINAAKERQDNLYKIYQNKGCR